MDCSGETGTGKELVAKAVANKSKTSLKNVEVQKCLTDKFKSWAFNPAPKGEVIAISYPIEFSN
jgi:Cdc6-like AAA superfamily ATPase